MSSISIQNTLVTDLTTDAVVRTSDEGAGRGFGSPPSAFQGASLRRLEFVCDSAAPGDTCFAIIAPGVHQKAKYMIHVVGPIVHGALTTAHEKALVACYTNVLDLCLENSLRSVAFCCISTGVFHFPNQRAAQIATDTVREWLSEHPGAMDRVIFNVFKDEDRRLYERFI